MICTRICDKKIFLRSVEYDYLGWDDCSITVLQKSEWYLDLLTKIAACPFCDFDKKQINRSSLKRTWRFAWFYVDHLGEFQVCLGQISSQCKQECQSAACRADTAEG